MMMNRILASLSLSLGLACAASAASVVIVNTSINATVPVNSEFAGSKSASNYTSVSGASSSFNYNPGDGQNDAYAVRPLSLDTALSPAVGAGYDSLTPVFFGGGVGWRSTPDSPHSTVAFNGSQSDLNGTVLYLKGGSSDYDYAGMLVWQKSGFANLSSEQIRFDTDSSLSFSGVDKYTLTDARWLVQSGGDWYLSDFQIASNQYSLAGVDLMNANWKQVTAPVGSTDPADYIFDTSSGFTTSTSALNDIQSVGFWYLEANATRANLDFRFAELEVMASAVPEPRTYAMIMGLLAVAVVVLRRRR